MLIDSFVLTAIDHIFLILLRLGVNGRYVFRSADVTTIVTFVGFTQFNAFSLSFDSSGVFRDL